MEIQRGDLVSFTTNTGATTTGVVLERINQEGKETILLLERPSDGWRAFRLPRDVKRIDVAEPQAVRRPH